MKKGAFNAYFGGLRTTFEYKEEAYLDVMVSALADTAEQYSSILTPSERETVSSLAKLIQANSNIKYQPSYKKIIAAMDKSGCEWFCKI